MIGCVFFKLESWFHLLGPCVLFRVYTVTDFCGVGSMCFAFTGSLCLVFVRHVVLRVLLWLVTCGCKNRRWSPKDLICIYIG
jgi:hypothetical protein